MRLATGGTRWVYEAAVSRDEGMRLLARGAVEAFSERPGDGWYLVWAGLEALDLGGSRVVVRWPLACQLQHLSGGEPAGHAPPSPELGVASVAVLHDSGILTSGLTPHRCEGGWQTWCLSTRVERPLLSRPP